MKRRGPFFYLLLLMLLGVFCYSGYQVGSYLWDSLEQKSHYDQLAELVAQAQTQPREEDAEPPATQAPAEPDAAPSAPAEDAEPGILAEYAALYEMNSDLVGWIRIDGTKVNYPVVQTPRVPEYYLYRNFDGKRSARGCIFVEETCDVNTPSDNVTLYGHCMKDGSMFAALSDYTARSYWQAHPLVQFDTLYAHRTYRVFAVFKTSGTVGKGFSYHSFVDADSPEAFDSFVTRCRELSLYDTGILPQYGDKLLCLSTCEYSQSNGRLVVVCVLEDPA